jgi:hypothetical protein
MPGIMINGGEIKIKDPALCYRSNVSLKLREEIPIAMIHLFYIISNEGSN